MSDCPTIGEGNSHLFWEKGIKWFNWNTNTSGKGDHVWVVVCSLLKCWRIFIKLFVFQTRSVGWTSETNETIEIKMSGSGELYLYFTVSLTQAYYFGVSTLVYNLHCVCPTHWNSSFICYDLLAANHLNQWFFPHLPPAMFPSHWNLPLFACQTHRAALATEISKRRQVWRSHGACLNWWFGKSQV